MDNCRYGLWSNQMEFSLNGLVSPQLSDVVRQVSPVFSACCWSMFKKEISNFLKRLGCDYFLY